MRTRNILFSVLAALSIAGCCNTSERTQAFERIPEDEGLDCVQVCERSLKPVTDSGGYDVLKCDEGTTEDDAPAVLCTFAETQCTTELH